jgi:putative membrane protein
MNLVAKVLVALVALEHAYILVLQMFLWTRPVALRAFSMSLETAEASARLAKNQGLYNGFLAAGVVWSLVSGPPLDKPVATFFVGFVLLAGVYGGVTAARRILWVQALPAALTLVAIYGVAG